MERINYWRFLRRVLLLAVVLILLVACSAQVKAENEPFSAEADAAALHVEEAGLTEENFSAVAVQLKAVARTQGRSISERMMHTALRTAAAQTENAVTPITVREGNLNVIVVPEKEPVLTLERVFVLAFVIFAAVLFAISVHTRTKKQRRSVYKPMRVASEPNNYYARYNTVRTYR